MGQKVSTPAKNDRADPPPITTTTTSSSSLARAFSTKKITKEASKIAAVVHPARDVCAPIAIVPIVPILVFFQSLPILADRLDYRVAIKLTLLCKQAITILAPIVSCTFYFYNRTYKYSIYSPKKFGLKIVGSNELDYFKHHFADWLPKTAQRLHLIYPDPRKKNGVAYDFHLNCDRRPNTLIVITSDKGYIFGGFTTQPWLGHPEDPRTFYQPDPKAFLFTLTNPYKIPPTKFQINPTKIDLAIYNDNKIACKFGEDLCLSEDYVNDTKMLRCHTLGFPEVYTDSTGLGYKIFSGEPTIEVLSVHVFMALPATDPVIPNGNYKTNFMFMY